MLRSRKDWNACLITCAFEQGRLLVSCSFYLQVPQAMRLCVQKCAAGFGKSKARTTLKLKCKVFQMRKLLQHNTAFYCPVARQMVPSQVLFRRLCQSLWTQTGWRRWIQRVCVTA